MPKQVQQVQVVIGEGKDLQMDTWYSHMLSLVEEAGKVVKEGFTKRNFVVEQKTASDNPDVVTEHDRGVENMLIRELSLAYPTHKFIGEETTYAEGKDPVLTDEPTWIIDPIDGTSNFVHGIPLICISVALVIKKQVEFGVVTCPMLGDVYTAKRGQGAYLNGKRIYTSTVEDISKALVAIEISLAFRKEIKETCIARTKAIVSVAHGLRSFGCAVISLCLVAAGCMDVYHVDGLYPWDMAAGGLLIREAGGYLLNSNGEEFDLMNAKIVAASTEKLARAVTDIFKEADSTVITNGVK